MSVVLKRVTFCVLLLASGLAQAARDTTIGVVLDGPWARDQGRLGLMQEEIRTLTDGEFNVRFPRDKQVHGNWTLAGVNQALDRLLADPSVDMVLALGVVASGEAARRERLPKPVVAPFIVGPQSNLPYDADSETSGKHNLNYLHAFNKGRSDILLLYELSKFKRLAILIDPLSNSVLERYELDKFFGQIPAEELYQVDAIGTPAEIVAQIPADADAVIVLPLLRLSVEELQQLASELIKRKLPALSVLGGSEIEAGFLAATTTENDLLRLTRRIAINVQRILLGENPGSIGVNFRETVRPVINMTTAHAIGLSPSYELMNSATILGDPDIVQGEALDLAEAVRQAMQSNIGWRSASLDVKSAGEDVATARAQLLPQLVATLDGREIDEDRAEASSGNAAHYQSSASLQLDQVLYSQRARAALQAQKLLQHGREAGLEAELLDVAEQAAVAYLDLLRAQELARIRKDDLNLTKGNLERARTRVQIGSASRAEVHRWESRIAEARQQQIEANVGVSQARVNLSRIMNRPLETRYRTVEPTLTDPAFLVSDPRFLKYISNPASVRILREFLVQEGLRNSPELEQLRLGVRAQKLALKSARRVFTHPEVGLQAEIREILAKGGAGQRPDPVTLPPPIGITLAPQGPFADNTDWSIGLSARLPLYSGGARSAEVRRASVDLAGTRNRVSEVAQSIETRIRVALYGAGGAYANIDWARQSFEAARSNLELVTDAYARGAVAVIDLLDAQNAGVRAESAAANSTFDFLIEFMRLQRAMGHFDFLMSDEERIAMYQRMDAYFAQAGSSVPEPETEDTVQ